MVAILLINLLFLKHVLLNLSHVVMNKDITRRNFVKATGIGGLGLALCRDLMEEAAEVEELLERSMAALDEEHSEAIDAIAARVASDRGHRPAKSEPDTLDELHEASERLAEAIGRLNKSIAAAEDD